MHRERGDAYAKGKTAAAEVLASWAQREGARFTDVVLPHVFGEHGRPFYNSVVSTFCHQLAHGEEPRIDVDGQLELLHAHDAVAAFNEAWKLGTAGEVRPTGEGISVSELLDRLRGMHRRYAQEHTVPDVRSALDLRLFNTLRSYLFPAHYPVPLELRTDERGTLFEAVRSDNAGQVFLSTTKPGVTRGNHFHLRKIERFLVVSGNARIRVRRLFGDTVQEFDVSGDTPAYVDIPTMHTHNLTNVGDVDMVALFWSHELFDPEAPDTIPEAIEV